MAASNRFRKMISRQFLYLVVGAGVFASHAMADIFTLTNGNLKLHIDGVTGAIDGVEFDNSTYYLPGGFYSQYGFQIGTDASTFSANPLPLEVINTGSTGIVSGLYQSDMAFVRTYSLIADLNAFQVSTTLVNLGAERTVRQYESFNPDQGYDLGEGYGTFDDVRSYAGPNGIFNAGHASSLSGLSVVMGSANPNTVVGSGAPFIIFGSSGLNDFFDNPFDGEGTFSNDQGTHLGLESILGTGASRTFTYVQAFGSTLDDAIATFTTAIPPPPPPPQPYLTELHPLNSEISLEIYLGNPSTDGVLLATVGPTDFTGSMNASVDLDSLGNGTLFVEFSDLTVGDILSEFVDLGTLGTVDVSLLGVQVDLTMSVPVVANAYSLDEVTLFEVTINGGTALLDNASGIIAGILEGDFNYDFADNPAFANQFNVIGLGLGGTTDLGPGLFSEYGEINLDLTGLKFSLFDLFDGMEVYARIATEIHVAVPEASSLTFVGLASLASAGLYYRRRRSSGSPPV